MRSIYLMKNLETNSYKIGISVDPKKRLKTLQTGSSGELILVESYKSDFFFKIETSLHNRYRHQRLMGEWFELGPIEVDSFIDNCKTIEKTFKNLVDQGNPFI